MAVRTISDILGARARGTSDQPGALNPPTPTPNTAKAKANASSRALVPTQAPAAPAAAAAPTTPPDDAAPLSAELTDMTEVIDALATIVASVSDRVSDQTDALDKLTKTAAETRQAAFAARAQSDPGQLAAEVTDALNAAMVPRLRELTAAVAELTRTAHAHGEARNRAETQLHDMKRDLQAARADALRWKGYLGSAVLSGVLLALVLFLVLPRVVPPTPFTCAFAGGRWLNNEACVFWAPEWNR